MNWGIEKKRTPTLRVGRHYVGMYRTRVSRGTERVRIGNGWFVVFRIAGVALQIGRV